MDLCLALSARRLARRALGMAAAWLLAALLLLVAHQSAHAQADYMVDDDSNDRPLLYMKFDEGSGTVTRSFPTAAPSIGSSGGMTGTLVGGAAFSTTLPALFTPPNFRALRLTGAPQHVRIIESSASAVLKALTSQWTVAAWVKRAGFNSVDTIYANGSVPGNTNNNNWSLQFNSANQIVLRSGQTIDNLTTVATVTDSNWHHIAATVSGGSAAIYLDGALVAQKATFAPPSTITGPSLVGARNEANPDGQYLVGLIDELRVYNRALSSAEVARLAAGRGCATDGHTWGTAYFDLQCALDPGPVNGGLGGKQVLVATGIYRTGTNPLAAFNLTSNLTLLGGFVPTGPNSADRPPFPLQQLAFPTFPIVLGVSNLSGDLLVNDFNGFVNSADNARSVLVANRVTELVVDGFAIGGARFGSGVLASEASGTLSHLHVTLNDTNASEGGGGLRLTNGSRFIVDNVNVQFNRSTSGAGGGVSVASGSVLTLTNSFVLQSSAGGGLSANGATLHTANVRVEGNSGVFGAGMRLNNSQVTLDGVRVAGNQATSGGGGLSIFSTAMNVISMTVANNRGSDGGGLFVSGAPLTLDNTRIISNTAVGGCALVFFCGRGGGLWAESELLTLGAGVVISDNLGTSGGGIFLAGPGHLQANGATLRNNVAVAPPPITPPAVESGQGGAAFLTNGAVMTLTNTIVEGNQALIACTDFTCPEPVGGGIAVSSGGQLLMEGGVVRSNFTDGDGGGIQTTFQAQLRFNGTTFELNEADSGGALHITGAHATLTDVTIRRNTTSGDGAGIDIRGPVVFTMTRGAFIENVSLEDAGAIELSNDTIATLDSVLILGNVGEEDGGAVTVESASNVTLRNAILVGNGLTINGSGNEGNAAYANDSTLRLINTTVVANHGADESALGAENGTITVQNSILRDNGQAHIGNDALATVVLQSTSQSLPGPNADPLFVRNPNPGDGNWATFADNDYGDLHLRGPSPEIDAGDGTLLPAAMVTDFEGQSRVFDANYAANAAPPPVDRGADEARFVGPTAVAGGPYNSVVGLPVPLDATGSSDDAVLASFAWDCTSDGSIEAVTNAPTGSSCTYSTAGTFTLRLIVTDADGISATATAQVTVTSDAPTSRVMVPIVFGE